MLERIASPEDVTVRRVDWGAWKRAGGRPGGPPRDLSYPDQLPPSSRPIFLAAERLVQIWTSNEELLARLQDLDWKLRRARAYLARPDANRKLGQACLEHCETTRANYLARLRENRRLAQELLSRLDGEHAHSPKARAAACSATALGAASRADQPAPRYRFYA